MDEYTPEVQEYVDTSAELRDKTMAVRDGGSCQGDIYQQTLNWAHCDIQNPADPLIHTQRQTDSHEQLPEY